MMKKLLVIMLLIVPSLAFGAEETKCDREFNRFGRHYCMTKERGRRGTVGYIPQTITSTLVKRTYTPRVIKKVVTPTVSRGYRAFINIKYDRTMTSRQRRKLAREAYNNYNSKLK